MKAYVLTGLGSGDETKGSTSDWVCWKENAHTIIRIGAPQAFHHVKTSDGRENTFSQFGSGTFRGPKTHLSSAMVIEPYAILNEGRSLIEEQGVLNAFDLMTIDENALVIAPFHKLANRIWELYRGKNRRGSVGIGVGEAIRDSEIDGEKFAIRAKDFRRPWLKEKLEAIRKLKLIQLASLIENASELPLDALFLIRQLQDESIIDEAAKEFNYLAETVDIVYESYLGDVLRKPGTVVFESSQGVLIDRYLGFHPYTTKGKITPDIVFDLLRRHAYQGEVFNFGILRAYYARHGNGPFVTEDKLLSLPDECNGEHPWQGNNRVGQFDAVMGRYAVNACGGAASFNGLAISCLDRLEEMPLWQICDSYSYEGNPRDLEGFVKVENGKITEVFARQNSRDENQLKHQQKLGAILSRCRPNFTNLSKGDYCSYIRAIEQRLGVRVVVESYGPTERDRVEK